MARLRTSKSSPARLIAQFLKAPAWKLNLIHRLTVHDGVLYGLHEHLHQHPTRRVPVQPSNQILSERYNRMTRSIVRIPRIESTSEPFQRLREHGVDVVWISHFHDVLS